MINITVIDITSSIESVIVEINGVNNVTVPLLSGNTYYTTITLNNGQYAISIFANDTAGNINSTQTLTFSVIIGSSTTPIPGFEWIYVFIVVSAISLVYILIIREKDKNILK